MNHLFSKRVLPVLVSLLLIYNPSVSADNTITMAFWAAPSNNPTWKWAELVYTEAFQRLGIEFRYLIVPPIRASFMADDGLVDGEPARSRSYADSHPNLVRVETNVTENHLMAYAKKEGIILKGWDSLRGTGYFIDYYRGIQTAKEHLEKVVPHTHFSSISTEEQALKKLIYGRIDLYIDSSLRVTALLKKPEFKSSGIYAAGIMMDLSSYPYLHKRHADLVPKLAKVLKQMKAEGLLKKLKKKAIQDDALKTK